MTKAPGSTTFFTSGPGSRPTTPRRLSSIGSSRRPAPPPAPCPQRRTAGDGKTLVVRVARRRRDGNVTEREMHNLVQTAEGIDYFVENHRLALTPTADYVSAMESAGLATRVIPNYMPGRDRVVGVRAANR